MLEHSLTHVLPVSQVECTGSGWMCSIRGLEKAKLGALLVGPLSHVLVDIVSCVSQALSVVHIDTNFNWVCKVVQPGNWIMLENPR